jgi:hypothetical protein
MDAQLVAQRLNEAFSNDDLWTRPSIVDDVEDLADEYDVLKAENERLRDLVYDLIVDEERGHNDDRTFREHVIRAHEYGIAQDVEVGE